MADTKQEWEGIAADKEFRQQPLSRQVRVASAFFDDRIAHQIEGDKAVKEQARKAFIDSYFPPEQYSKAAGWEPVAGASLGQKLKAVVDAGLPGLDDVKAAAKANAELFSRIPRAMADLSMSHLRYASEAKIPGSAAADEIEKFYPEMASNVAEHLSKRGYPKLGEFMGAMAGTAGLPATVVAAMYPRTGADLEMQALSFPIFEGAATSPIMRQPLALAMKNLFRRSGAPMESAPGVFDAGLAGKRVTTEPVWGEGQDVNLGAGAARLEGPGAPPTALPAPRPKPMPPVDHVATAQIVVSGGFEGPDIAVLAKDYPRVYAVTSGQTQLPPTSGARINDFLGTVRRSMDLGPGAPVNQGIIAEGLKTGKLSPLVLSELDRSLFNDSAMLQGSSASALPARWEESRAAAQRPAETLIVEDAHRRSVLDFEEARDLAIRRGKEALLEAPGAAVGAPKAVEAPPASPETPEAPLVKSEPQALPQRGPAVVGAIEDGVPGDVAQALHRQAALDAQESGSLEPEVAQGYAAAGDTSFDPEALEEASQTTPWSGSHPLEMSPEDRKRLLPDMSPEDWKAWETQMEEERLDQGLVERAETLRRSGTRAQPAHDELAESPVTEESALANGISGDLLKSLMKRGAVVRQMPEGGVKESYGMDAALQRLKAKGVLPEDADLNAMVEMLDDESRLGSRREAQKALYRGESVMLSEKKGEYQAGETSGQSRRQDLEGTQGPRRLASQQEEVLAGSSGISVDENLGNVKAQADDLLAREAAARGMVNDEDFRLKMMAQTHRELGQASSILSRELMSLEGDARKAFENSYKDHPLYILGQRASKNHGVLRGAYPDVYEKMRAAIKGENREELLKKQDDLLKDLLPPKRPEGGHGYLADAGAGYGPGRFDAEGSQGLLFDTQGNVNPEAEAKPAEPTKMPVEARTIEAQPELAPAQKAAWEMTAEEFAKKPRGKITFSGKDSYFVPEEGERVLHPGTRSRAKVLKEQHRYDVARAVESGKDVPDVVLLEYPDLKARADEKKAAGEVKKPVVATQLSPSETKAEIGVRAGEELWYNRRNIAGKGISWSDVKDLNVTLKTTEVQKSKVWPRPDYQQLVGEGLNPIMAFLIKNVYDSIGVKPAMLRGAAGDEDLRLYIEEVQRVKAALYEWANDKGVQKLIVSALEAMSKSSNPFAFAGSKEMSEAKKALFERVYGDLGPGGFRGNADANRKAILLGGNRFVQAIQPGRDVLEKAAKAIVKEGWPKARESWQVRFDVEEVPAGTKVYRDGKEITTTEATFDVVTKGGRYRRIVSHGHQTREAAIAEAKKAAERQGSGTRVDAEKALENVVRVGPPRRPGGLDVKPEDLMRTFGFRGVNYGNWTNQGERQTFTNHAYDALLDLAELIHIDPQAVSLDGLLGLAYGAQGTGGRSAGAAHFVPGVNEVNLTKDKGAGSVAHEWGHALDHYFAVQAGLGRSDDPFLSAYAELDTTQWGTLRHEIRQAFRDIVKAIKVRPETMEEAQARVAKEAKADEARLDRWLQYFRKDLEKWTGRYGQEPISPAAKEKALADFDAIAARMRAGDLGDGFEKIGGGPMSAVHQTVGEVRRLFKDVMGHVPNPKELSSLDWSAHMAATRKDAAKAAEALKPQDVKTEFYQQARALEGSTRVHMKKGYWTSPSELFARAFQSYVMDRLATQGLQNDYLSYPQLPTELYKALEGGDRYPRGSEREAINAAFDALIAAIKVKPGAKGMMLYDAPADVYGAAPAPVHSEETYGAGTDESAKAFGRGVDLEAVKKQLLLDLDFGGGSKQVSKKLAADGKVDYTGLVIGEGREGILDLAEIVASRRHPGMEHLNIILLKGREVVAHRVYTSGLPHAVLVPEELVNEINREAYKLGADGILMGHNHPSGNAGVSFEDRQMGWNLKMKWGDKFRGQIVTDDIEFAFMAVGDPEYIPFRSRQKSFLPEGPAEFVSSDEDAAAFAMKQANVGEDYMVILLNARHRVMGVVHYPKGEGNVPGRVRRDIKEAGASRAIIVAPKGKPSLRGETSFGMLPREVVDAIQVSESGDVKRINTGPRPDSVYGELRTWRVAEDLPRYMGGGMDAEDFAAVVEKRGVKAGMEITARVPFEGVKRGTKGTLKSFNVERRVIVADFGGRLKMTRPDNVVETYARPARLAALAEARRIEAAAAKGPAVPTKQTIHEQQAGLVESEEVRLTAKAALKLRLSSQAYGARKAARAAATEARHAIEESFIKEKWEQATRRKVVEFVKKFLPKHEQGTFLGRAVEAKTPVQLLRVYQEIRWKAEDVHRRERVRDIKVLVKRVIDSPTFPVGFKRRVAERLDGLRFENWTPESMDKVRADEAFVESLKESGEDVVVPAALLRRISKLSDKPLAEMPPATLDAIYEDLLSLAHSGVEVKKMALALDETQRLQELAELTEGPGATKGIRSRMSTQGKKRLPTAPDLTWMEQHKNDYLKSLDELQRLRLVVTPASFMFEMIDGFEDGPSRRLILDRLQGPYAAYLEDLYSRYIGPRNEAFSKWGDVGIQEAERVGVAIQAMQEGGREKLNQLGIPDDQVDAIVGGLTPRETEMVAWCKSMIETGTAEMMRVSAAVDNVDFKKLDNYFSMLTDWEAMQDAADVGVVVAPSYSAYRREADKKFLKERVAGARQKIVLDPFKVLDLHMPAKLYYIHMAKALKEANALAKTPEYREAAGDVGHTLVVQWLDVMARMGGVEGARRTRWLGALRRNFSLAQMAFNPGTILTQYSSLGDGAAAIGGKYMAQGVAKLMDEDFQKMILGLSPKLKYRGEGRNQYTDVMPGSRMSRMERAGFKPIQWGDEMAARAIFGGAYMLYLDLHGIPLSAGPNAEAAAFAQERVDTSQASPQLIDMPLVYSGGRMTGNVDWDRALSQFGLFGMSRSSHVFNDILGRDWKRGDHAKAAARVSWILGAMAMESGMRMGLALAAGAFSYDQAKRPDSFMRQMGQQVLGLIPIIPNAVQSAIFGRSMVPAMDVFNRAGRGVYEVFAGASGGKPGKTTQGIIDLLTAAAAYKGVPGSGVAGRMVRRLVPSDKPTPGAKSRRSRPQRSRRASGGLF